MDQAPEPSEPAEPADQVRQDRDPPEPLGCHVAGLVAPSRV